MTETKKCEWCNTEFARTSKNTNNWHLKKFCCYECSQKYHYYRRQKPSRRLKQTFHKKTVKCVWCEREFIQYSSANIYCSSACRNQYKHYRLSGDEVKHQLHEKRCRACGKVINVTRSDAVFCSPKCNLWWQDHMGDHRKQYKARQYNLGMDQYIELTQKCVICGWERNIHLHHIVQKSHGGANDPSNYIPLCGNCHTLMHMYRNNVAEVSSIVQKWIGSITGAMA